MNQEQSCRHTYTTCTHIHALTFVTSQRLTHEAQPAFATVRGKNQQSPVPPPEEPAAAAKPKLNRFQSSYVSSTAAPPSTAAPEPPRAAEEPVKPKVFRPVASAYGGNTSAVGGGGGNSDTCLECGKRTYPTDRLQADDKVFHKACFRCAHCNAVIKLGSYAALEGKYYCKVRVCSLVLARTCIHT